MDELMYKKISKPFKDHKYGVKALVITNKIITTFVYILYPTLLAFLLIKKDLRFIRVFLTPAISFNLLSLFRIYFNFLYYYILH